MNEADKARACFESLHCFLSEMMISEDPEIQLHVDEWRREEGGGGKTSALSNGVWMEKGGINFSDVQGENLPASATQNRPELIGSRFRAMGVSVVFHPLSPHVPTAHANVRYFEATTRNGSKSLVVWRGIRSDPILPYS